MDSSSRIVQIIDRWFLSEPLLFVTFHSHTLTVNPDILCPFRSGKGRIEYNPDLIEKLTDVSLELCFRKEILRILLKHPYQRQPLGAIPEVLSLASDITIWQHSNYGTNIINHLSIFLPSKLSFEEYYNLLLQSYNQIFSDSGNVTNSSDDKNPRNGRDKGKSSGDNGNQDETDQDTSEGDGMNNSCSDSSSSSNSSEADEKMNDNCAVSSSSSPSSSSSNSNSSESDESDGEICSDNAKADAAVSEGKEMNNIERNHPSPSDRLQEYQEMSALWEEDDWIAEKMNKIIENAMTSNSWGSVPGSMKALLEASIETTLNVIRQLGLFRASILSNERRLTRMRPNRRYGWEQMGVVHPYTTKLLIATDVSASVKDTDISRFFGVINRFFRYGIPQIDVLEFDAGIKLPVIPIRKAKKDIKVLGRGGTNFQPVIDYFNDHKEYDGLIIFTDGYALPPNIPVGRKVLWVLRDYQCYNNFELTPKVYI